MNLASLPLSMMGKKQVNEEKAKKYTKTRF